MGDSNDGVIQWRDGVLDHISIWSETSVHLNPIMETLMDVNCLLFYQNLITAC